MLKWPNSIKSSKDETHAKLKFTKAVPNSLGSRMPLERTVHVKSSVDETHAKVQFY
jgi:hypothetical protein